MGWENDLFALFDDLEERAGALYAADREAEVADRSRAEYQQVTLAGRLMATIGQEVTVGVAGVGTVPGVLDRVCGEWIALSGADQDWIVLSEALTTVEGASVRAIPEVAWSPLTRLGIAAALRRLAETGERCVVHLRDGWRYDGELRRVGADFCELVVGEERRVLLVSFAALAAVQSRGE